MKIAINLLSIQSPYSGAAVYAFNILNQLLKNCGDLNISIFCQDAIKSKLTELKLYPSNSAKIKFCFFEFQSIYHRIFFEQYKFIKILNSEKFDILHSFSNICPIHYKKPQILTLHDIIFQKYPTRYTFAKKIYYSYFIKKSISAANKILVPTQTTADDLIEYYNIEKNKIIIIPYSINFFLTNIQISELKKEDIKKKIGLPNNYFLFVGALEPGKNINFLIKLMNEFIEKYSADYKIVIVG
ncbi:MAG TPA: glycosyltransferase, partial [bacterium]|nr:glycosyltransferase [bacterium]